MKPEKINLHVRYPASPKPFVDPQASPAETLQSVKARVLTAFEIAETDQVVYFLYDGDTKLGNLALTLGEVAAGRHELKLRLVQDIKQGDAQSLDEKCFEADVEAVKQADGATRWKIDCAPLEILVHVASAKASTDIYVARLRWDRYPQNPPSLKFIDANGGERTASSWPLCPGFRPTSFDACVSWTREGMSLHPEWVSAPAARWDPSGNAILRCLNILQETLDYHYTGRYAG